MKTFASLFAVMALSLTLVAQDAEAARRLGGGKSVGMQRESMSAQKPVPPSTPAQNPAASPAPMQSAAAAPAAAAATKRSWMGPLAGLAAGLGLAALASHFGFGEGLATVMLIALLAIAAVAVIGMIMRRRTPALQPAAAGAPWAANSANEAPVTQQSQPMQYASVNPVPGTHAPAGAVASGARVPADFDAEGFVRAAKVSFLRLQAANDSRNLDDIREFTTPEMFGEIKSSFLERGSASQETDVVELAAQVVEVAEETGRHVVSVRFTGTARMDRGGEIEAIDEIWHIVKPSDGSRGWLLAGIQQLQ